MAFPAQIGLPFQWCLIRRGSMILFLLMLLPLLAPGVAAQAPPPLGRPGCQTQCGDVKVPYPFGIVSNATDCAHSVAFALLCNNSKLTFTEEDQYEVTSISLDKGQAVILIKNRRWCDPNPKPNPDGYDDGRPFILSQTSFTFSHSNNRFVAIGCNALASVSGDNNRYSFGCMSTCTNSSDPLLVDGSCSGLGCCQASIPTGLNFFIKFTRMSNRTIPWMTMDNSSAPACGYAVLVANNNYTFQKSHLQWQGDRFFPVVLDFFIEQKTCQEVERVPGSSLCKSTNSVCVDSSSAERNGYICNCARGYQGNPYLTNGCQDINECDDPKSCNGTCLNTAGSFECIPPKSKKNIGIIIGLSSGFGILLLLLGVMLLRKRFLKRKQQKQRQRFFKHNYDIILRQQMLCGNNESVVDRIKFFSLQDLEKATSKFDKSLIVGNGGHGTVYKGLLGLQVVAIKKSKVTTEMETEQFINEVILLSQLNHRNVVKLVGCCLESEVPLLAYEFIANGTLHDQLHHSDQESTLLWHDRLRIASEITSALAYLHSAANVSIFHRDIKSSNILLDDKLTAKVSDFGASRTVEWDQTHISTNIQGTFGYLDPEYMHTSQLTEKSDVYSMGVILVELLTGKKPTSKINPHDERNLISQFMWAFHENKLFEVIDPLILEDASKEEVETIAQVSIASLSMRGKDRPSMKEIELTLEGLKKGNKLKKKDSYNYQPHKQIYQPEISSIIPRSGTVTATETIEAEDLVPLVGFER